MQWTPRQHQLNQHSLHLIRGDNQKSEPQKRLFPPPCPRHPPPRETKKNTMAAVDTSLPTEPTAAAAALAAAHSADHTLKLYGGWFCPFVQRAWIVLVEKNIPHQYVEINPYHKAPEFLALNPRGLVPTLAVPAATGQGGKKHRPLYESSVVCEYLDEAYAALEHGHSLLPRGDTAGEVYERARCRL